MIKRKINILLLIASVLTISACSTIDKEQNARLDSMQKEINELKQINEQTAKNISNVEQTANNARNLAEQNSTSNQRIQQTAEDANERSLRILNGLRELGR